MGYSPTIDYLTSPGDAGARMERIQNRCALQSNPAGSMPTSGDRREAIDEWGRDHIR
jgi:hypothetical protein